METTLSAEWLERLSRLDRVMLAMPGRSVIPHNTTLYKHLPETCLGAWWYDTVTGTLDYSSSAKNPWRELDFPEVKDPERWIPGLVFRYPEDQQVYVAVYLLYFIKRHPLSGKTFADLLEQVLRAVAVPVADVVDNRGNTLLEMAEEGAEDVCVVRSGQVTSKLFSNRWEVWFRGVRVVENLAQVLRTLGGRKR